MSSQTARRIEALEEMIRAAGARALEYFGRVTGWHKEDGSLVSEADLQVEAELRSRVARHFRRDGFIGEERGHHPSSDTGYTWIVDPIDGTSSFLRGLPLWSVSVGLLERGEPVAGGILLPVVGELYSIGPDGFALCEGKRIRGPYRNEPLGIESVLFVPSRAHRHYGIDFPGKLRNVGSTAAHLAYLSAGAADGALLGWTTPWDIAAGVAIARAAGHEVGLLGGGELDLRAALETGRFPEPVLAGPVSLLADLRARIELRRR